MLFYYASRDIRVDKKGYNLKAFQNVVKHLKIWKLHYFAYIDFCWWPIYEFRDDKLSQVTNLEKFCGHWLSRTINFEKFHGNDCRRWLFFKNFADINFRKRSKAAKLQKLLSAKFPPFNCVVNYSLFSLFSILSFFSEIGIFPC